MRANRAAAGARTRRPVIERPVYERTAYTNDTVGSACRSAHRFRIAARVCCFPVPLRVSSRFCTGPVPRPVASATTDAGPLSCLFAIIFMRRVMARPPRAAESALAPELVLLRRPSLSKRGRVRILAHDLFPGRVRDAVRHARPSAGVHPRLRAELALGIAPPRIFSAYRESVAAAHSPSGRPSCCRFDGPGAFSDGAPQQPDLLVPDVIDDLRYHNLCFLFDGVTLLFPAPLHLIATAHGRRLNGELVTRQLLTFDVLGVPRTAAAPPPDTNRTPGGHPCGDQATLTTFGCAASAAILPLLKTGPFSLNGLPMTILGVTPCRLLRNRRGERSDVMVPVTMKAQRTPRPGTNRRTAGAAVSPLCAA